MFIYRSFVERELTRGQAAGWVHRRGRRCQPRRSCAPPVLLAVVHALRPARYPCFSSVMEAAPEPHLFMVEDREYPGLVA